MKRGLAILIMLLMIPAVNASISIDNIGTSKLNLGDNIKITGKIKPNSSNFAVMELTLKCAETNVPLLIKSLTLTAGKEQTFSENLPIPGNVLGSCTIEAVLKVKGETLDKTSSNSIIVSRDLIGTFDIGSNFLHLGDDFKITGSVTRVNGKPINGFGNLYLLFNGNVAFADTIEISNGVLKYTRSTSEMPSGTYTAKLDVSDVYGNTDSFEIGTVEILSSLKVNAETPKERYNPGDKVTVEGSVLKSTDLNADSGIARASFNEELYEASFSKGYFKVIFEIPKHIRSGDHIVEVEIVDDDGNSGKAYVTVKVNPIPTSLDVILGNANLGPEGVLSVTPYVYDQAEDYVITSVKIEVLDAKGDKLFRDNVPTNETLELGLTPNAAPGDWIVNMELGKLKQSKKFNVYEKIDLDINIENQTMYIRNLGNVKVKDTLTILFSGPEDIAKTKKINLNVDEGTSIDLGSGLATGLYNVEVNGETFSGVSIVKKRNYVMIFAFVIILLLLFLLSHMASSFVRLSKKLKFHKRERDRGHDTAKKIVQKKQYEAEKVVKKDRPFAQGVKEFKERILANARKQEREETRKRFMEDFMKKK